MSDVLGASVVGLGVGEQHARTYAALDECRLCSVNDFDRSRSERVIRELGQGVVAEEYDEILSNDFVQVVSIATYDDMHFEQVLAALEAGKHVFVEKPLCRTLDELKTIKGKWLDSDGLHLTSNLVLRAAPVYRWLKEQISEGVLGEIYAFDGDYLYGRIQKITEGWRKEVENYSVMQGGGVHLVDLLLWLTGEKPTSVTSVGNRICTKGTAFKYHDFMSAVYEFPSGMVGRITSNFGCVHRHHHVMRVFGTKATFIYDDQGPRLHSSRDPSLSARPIDLSCLPSAKGDLIPAYVKDILEGEEVKRKTQHEFDLISACVAADEALRKSQAVGVDYV